MDDRIYRCSDGHLYSAALAKSSLLSVHLGKGAHWQRCPVDRHWRTASPVDRNSLTEEQIAEARKHEF
jgi:hypothetical protein